MRASDDKKKSFILYADWYATISLLSEKASFLDAIFQHNAGKTDIHLEDRIKPFLEMVFAVMDANKAKYIEHCEENAKNANMPPKNPKKQRGRPRKEKLNG